MSVRTLDVSSNTPLQYVAIDDKTETTDHLSITITSLLPWQPSSIFSDNRYRPRYNNCHPFDIDYREHEKYKENSYLKVTYSISKSIQFQGLFIPVDDNGQYQTCKSITSDSKQTSLFSPTQDSDNTSITFYVKQGPKITKPTSYNLGFRFINQFDPHQLYDGVYDPTVPHDGS